MEALLQAAAPYLVDLVVGLVSLAAVPLFAKLKALISAKVDNAKLEGALLKVNDLVQTLVLDLNQTAAAEFRKAAADGKITKAEAEHLKNVALIRAKALLGREGQEFLKGALGLDTRGLDQFLEAKVEASVAQAKNVSAILPKLKELASPLK